MSKKNKLALEIGGLEFPSLALRGPKAEDVMDQYIDFRDAYGAVNEANEPMSKEDSKESMTQLAEMQQVRAQSIALRKAILEETDPIKKQNIQEEITKAENKIVEIGGGLVEKENLMNAAIGRFTPEKLKEIRKAEANLKELTKDLIEGIAASIMGKDKKTPLYSPEDYETLTRGEKHQLIWEVAIFPANGFSTSFLKYLGKVMNPQSEDLV